MGVLDRINTFLSTRLNINPSLYTDEAIEQPRATAYCDPLIYWQHDNYGNIVSRRMCLYLDPLINALTEGWASLATAKQFKFYSSHGVDGTEVMQEYRQWWKLMNLDELLKAIIPHFEIDGCALFEMGINPTMGGLDYEVYGSYECAPVHWYRDANNDIMWYNVQYTPMPRPFIWNYGGAQLQGVSKQYLNGELMHVTRGAWNYGLGNSRILPIWDSAVKLRTGSHADFFRRDIRFLVAIPEGWKDDKASNFMTSMNEFLRSRRRSFIYRMEQAKTADQTPLELPRFGFESLAKEAPNPKSQSEAGGALLRDPEWARFLSGCKHTENYFIGNQSGAVTGSEVDLTRDFYTECEEFALLEPVIKAIINWFAERGMIPPPPQDYVVKYWKDWEHQEMASQLAQQEMMQESMTGPQNKQNELANTFIIGCIRNNLNSPGMIPVQSSWVEQVGVKDRTLWFKFHGWDKGPYAGYQFGSNDIAFQKYLQASEGSGGSTGAWIWDTIWAPGTQPFSKGPRQTNPGINEEVTGIIYSNDPFGSEVPYQERGLGGYEQKQEYLTQGEPQKGLLGTQGTRQPMQLTTKPSTDLWSEASQTTTQTDFDYGESTGVQYDWGYTHNPESITGSTKMGPGRKRSPGKSTVRAPLNPVNITKPVQVGNERAVFNSASALMRLAKDRLDWGMSKSTAYNIMQLVDQVRQNVYRINSMAYGNGIKADHAMFYDVGGVISKEYICVDSYKKNIGKTVPLGIYHNKDQDSPDLPDWQVIGTYTIKGWDEELGQDIAEIDFDEDRINEVFEKLKEPNWIKPYLDKGKFPDVSTAYYCDVKWDGAKKRNIQTNINVKSVSIVPAGNCPGNVCSFTPQMETLRDNRWITKRGKHIWIESNYTPEEYYEAMRFKGTSKFLTKKELKELDRNAELDPWIKVANDVDLSQSTEEHYNPAHWTVYSINTAMDILPLKIKKMIKEVKIYNSTADDPHFLGRQNEVPDSYKKVGCEKTWKEVGGCYIPDENRAIISAKDSRGMETLWHEVGHAVWYHINLDDRFEFGGLFRSEDRKALKTGNKNRIRAKLGDYEANSVKELFAESFSRYWYAQYNKLEGYKSPRMTHQHQKIGWVSRFFNTRMQKYFKEE